MMIYGIPRNAHGRRKTVTVKEGGWPPTKEELEKAIRQLQIDTQARKDIRQEPVERSLFPNKIWHSKISWRAEENI
jgi:hypothetical protein